MSWESNRPSADGRQEVAAESKPNEVNAIAPAIRELIAKEVAALIKDRQSFASDVADVKQEVGELKEGLQKRSGMLQTLRSSISDDRLLDTVRQSAKRWRKPPNEILRQALALYAAHGELLLIVGGAIMASGLGSQIRAKLRHEPGS